MLESTCHYYIFIIQYLRDETKKATPIGFEWLKRNTVYRKAIKLAICLYVCVCDTFSLFGLLLLPCHAMASRAHVRVRNTISGFFLRFYPSHCAYFNCLFPISSERAVIVTAALTMIVPCRYSYRVIIFTFVFCTCTACTRTASPAAMTVVPHSVRVIVLFHFFSLS